MAEAGRGCLGTAHPALAHARTAAAPPLFPDAAAARLIGPALVEKPLAVLVNFIPGVESVYYLQGKGEGTVEVFGRPQEQRAPIRQNYPDAIQLIPSLSL